jgi:hypothetical protein
MQRPKEFILFTSLLHEILNTTTSTTSVFFLNKAYKISHIPSANPKSIKWIQPSAMENSHWKILFKPNTKPLNCIRKGEQDQGICETWEPIQIPYYNCIQKICIHLNPKPWEESKASLLELIGLCDSIVCILIAHIQKEFWTQNAHILFSPSPIGQCLSQCHRYVDIAFDCVHSLWGFGWVLHLLLRFL